MKTETVGRRDEKNGIKTKTGKHLEKWTRDEKEKNGNLLFFDDLVPWSLVTLRKTHI